MTDLPEPGWTTPATVTRVIDGDTLEVEVRRTLRVRLLDCWAPESRIDPRVPEDLQEIEKARGIQSKKSLQAMAEGRDVVVFIPTHGQEVGDVFSMSRVLGRVWIAGEARSLSERQVARGQATAAKVTR